MNIETIKPVLHGLMMAVLALILGAMWAAFMAVNHESLHSGFEAQEQKVQQAQTNHLNQNFSMDHAHSSDAPTGHHHDPIAGNHANSDMHAHSGSLARDAMQRLLRGHIHFMGLGVLSAALLLITTFTSLKTCWKKVLGWTFGLGALAYPPAWILMGFRTVELGPQAAEASVMWLFGPAVGLLLASMTAVLGILAIEMFCLHKRVPFLACFFQQSAP